jgi:hypothetical protein
MSKQTTRTRSVLKKKPKINDTTKTMLYVTIRKFLRRTKKMLSKQIF